MIKLFKKTLLVVFSLLGIVHLSGHSGRTDSKGGHHDRKNGGYHYHNKPSYKAPSNNVSPRPTTPRVTPSPIARNKDVFSGHIGCYYKKCFGKLLIKTGRYGKFYGCSNFPKCKATTNYPFRCYRCKSTMVARTNKSNGTKFWGCSTFPKCRHTNDYR